MIAPALAPLSVQPALTILILAGGRSSRMGQDKAWLRYQGVPLVERLARRLLPLAGEVIFSSNTPDRFTDLCVQLPVPSQPVPDLHPGAGPLAGLHAGLTAAQHDLVFAVATDMPFVNLDLVRYMAGLAEGFDVVIPVLGAAEVGTIEPGYEALHAIYRRTCLSAIADALAAGRRRVISFLPAVRTREVLPDEIAQFDPQFRSFVNANTPDDWARQFGEVPDIR